MAIKVNAKGTLYASFSIGKGGATIYQGTTAPVNGTGNSGDLYLYINGSSSEILQNQGGTWLAGAGGISSITAGSGLSGGTITSSGTISLTATGTAGSYNNVTTDSYGRVTSGSNVSYLTTNQNISITGDATGNGSTAITLTLGTTGVTAGTYQGIVVNSKGLITGATNKNYGTGSVTSIATGTGLTGGPITNTGTVSMGTSGVTAGSYAYGNFTVDALGRITQATAGSPYANVVVGESVINLAAASGTQTIAIGGSFIPKFVIFQYGINSGTGYAMGLDSCGVTAYTAGLVANTFGFTGGASMYYVPTGGAGTNYGSISSTSAGTFVISWTKIGSATGTLEFNYMAVG